ncbi:hypothetical protein BCR43DRAFT_111232 [Syncephalastrum racemosum]|uniref:Uncharacterized protein n=1 Tax=Syncephalastrum racemosum TaxID=13706 RepID=A0A1X2H003_SYNRA|nr:hypothetical protein BCR43DRAFT_111232 [Syncephalastrum racemosum]
MRFTSLTLVAAAFIAVGSQAALTAEPAGRGAPRAAEVYKRNEGATEIEEGRAAVKISHKRRQAPYIHEPVAAENLVGKRGPNLKRNPGSAGGKAVQPEGNKPAQKVPYKKRQVKTNQKPEGNEPAMKAPVKREPLKREEPRIV